MEQALEAGEDLLGLGGGAAGGAGVLVARSAGAFLFPEDDGEFVAADASDEIVIADAAAHEVGGLFEDVIADGVAEAIVVMFEVVDVEEEEGHGE